MIPKLRVSTCGHLRPVVQSIWHRLVGPDLPPSVVLTVDGVSNRFLVGNVFEYRQLMRYDSDPDGAVLADFVSRIEPTDVVWDVGAHVGVYASFAAAIVGAGSVIAVEPHPRNVVRLQSNLDRNECDVTVCQCALADATGEATLSVSGPDVEGAFGLLSADEGTGTTVQVTTGDRLVDEDALPAPTVLKMDIEGAERAALRGFRSTLASSTCRLAYVNVYEKYFDDPADGERVYATLEERGFDVTRIADWSDGYFLRGTADELRDSG